MSDPIHPARPARTVQYYLDAMRHELGLTPARGHSLMADLNDAGRWLLQAGKEPPFLHEWSWLVVHEHPLSLEANDPDLYLPPDFESLQAIQFANSLFYQFWQVDAGTLLSLATSAIVTPNVLYYCVQAGKRPPDNAAPRRSILRTWPVQTADRSDIRITYTRGWPGFPEEFGDNPPKGILAWPVDVPEQMQKLLELKCRVLAYETETGDISNKRPMLDEELARQVRRDVGKSTMGQQPQRSATTQARRCGPNGQWISPWPVVRVP